MATTTSNSTTSELAALANVIKTQGTALKDAKKEFTKEIADLLKSLKGIVKEDAKSIEDSLKKFEDNAKKQRDKNNQLRMTEMKTLQKEMGVVEGQISFSRVNKLKEQLEISLKIQQDYNKKIKHLETFELANRLAKHKEFYRKVDASFNNFNNRTSKLAGKLDSLFSTNFFSSLQKAGMFLGNIGKTAFKLGIGTVKFATTALSKERGGGLKAAMAQTKIGKGVRTAARTFRQTKIGAKKAVKTFKNFMSGGSEKKGGITERIQKSGDAAATERSNTALKSEVGKGATAGSEAYKGQFDFFGWLKKFTIMKWLWEQKQKILQYAQTALGFAKSAVSFLALPVVIGAVIGIIINRAITAIANAISRSADKQIAALQKQTEKEKAVKDLGKEKWSKIGLDKNQQGTLTAQASQSLLKKDKGYKAEKDKWQELGEKFNKGDASEKEIAEMNRLNYTLAKKLENEKDKLYKKQIAGNKIKEKIFEDAQKQYKDNSVKQRNNMMEDEKKDELMRKAEAIRKAMPTSGAALKNLFSFGLFGKSKEQEQQEIYEKLKSQQKPQKGFAQGTAGTGQPRRMADVYRKTTGQENINLHPNEWFSVLNKDQYEKMKDHLNVSLPNKSIFGKMEDHLNVSLPNKSIFGKMEDIFKNFSLSKKIKKPEVKDQESIAPSSKVDLTSFTTPNINTSIQKLESGFKNKLTNMLGEYKKLSGKTAPINEAYRDTKYQKELYDADLAKKKLNPAHRMKTNKPGTSPHEKGIAADLNTANVDEMDYKYDLLNKYKLRRPSSYSRTGPGKRHESWHIQAKEGAAFEKAPKDFMMKGHAGEGAFVAKTKEFETVFKYFEMGKKLNEEVSKGAKNISFGFSKDKPGQELKNLQNNQGKKETQETNQVVKLLTDIKSELEKNRKDTAAAGKENRKPSIPPAPSYQGVPANYQSRSDIFPSDTLMTNMFTLMTQFNGGY